MEDSEENIHVDIGGERVKFSSKNDCSYSVAN